MMDKEIGIAHTTAMYVSESTGKLPRYVDFISMLLATVITYAVMIVCHY